MSSIIRRRNWQTAWLPIYTSEKAPQGLRGLQPTVARHDLEIAGDENGVGEPELQNRFLDQLELLSRMRPGIAGVGTQAVGRNVLDLKVRHWQASWADEQIINIGA